MDLRTLLSTKLNSAQTAAHDTYDHASQRVLDRLGLQPKRTTSDVLLPALGIFTAGIAAGAVLGLLFAPRRGEETRNELVHRLEDAREQLRRSEEANAQS